MKIIVGLGNPGLQYARTKHNVGFMLADKLAERLNIDNWREQFNALVSETFINAEKVLLVKPQTFMNLSGEAVQPIMDYYKIPTENLTVIHDDMDLSVGIIRLRPKGSGGGHHGVESIIQHLGGDENFARIRIGIGRPPVNWEVNPHVLSPFNEDDLPKIKEAINYLVPAAICVVTEGINQAMNKFNPKKKKPEKLITEMEKLQ